MTIEFWKKDRIFNFSFEGRVAKSVYKYILGNNQFKPYRQTDTHTFYTIADGLDSVGFKFKNEFECGIYVGDFIKIERQ